MNTNIAQGPFFLYTYRHLPYIYFLLISKTIEITGFSYEEAIGKPLVSTFIVPKLQTSVSLILDNALKGRETSNYELEFTTKSKQIRYLLGQLPFYY